MLDYGLLPHLIVLFVNIGGPSFPSECRSSPATIGRSIESGFAGVRSTGTVPPGHCAFQGGDGYLRVDARKMVP